MNTLLAHNTNYCTVLSVIFQLVECGGAGFREIVIDVWQSDLVVLLAVATTDE